MGGGSVKRKEAGIGEEKNWPWRKEISKANEVRRKMGGRSA